MSMEYRVLQQRETLKFGDEVFRDGKWQSCAVRGLRIHSAKGEFLTAGHYRRPIKETMSLPSLDEKDGK
jgi:hypothetical protein